MRIQKIRTMNLKTHIELRRLENQVKNYEIKAIQAIYGIKIDKNKYKLG